MYLPWPCSHYNFTDQDCSKSSPRSFDVLHKSPNFASDHRNAITADPLIVLSKRSKALSEQLRREKGSPFDPGNRHSRQMSIQSAELPPYKYAMPQQHVEHHSSGPVEADSIVSKRYTSESLLAISPEFRYTDHLGGYPFPQNQSSPRNEGQR